MIDPDGTLHEVARSGHSLLGSTIDVPQFLGNYIDDQFYLGDADLRLAGMRGLNNAGQVAFWAQLEDLSGGLFLWGAEILFVDGFESGDTSAWQTVTE